MTITKSHRHEIPIARQSERAVARSIFSNVGLQYLNSLLNLVIGLVLVKVLSNYLGIEGYGNYNLVLGFVTTFQIFTDWGVTTIALRELAKDRSRFETIIGNLFLIRSIMALFAVVFCLGMAVALGYSTAVLSNICLFAVFLLLCPLEIFTLVFQVDLRGKYTVLPTMLAALLNFGAILMVVRLNLSTHYIFAMILVATGLRHTISMWLSRRFAKPDFAPVWSWWGKYLLMALPIGAASLVSAVFQQIDLLMLSWFDSAYAVGIYSAGLRLTNFTAFIPLAISTTLFPLFSSYYQNAPERLRRLFQQVIDLMLFLAFPMAITLTLLSDKIIALLFRADFAPAAQVLALNSWTSFLSFTSIIAGQGLLAIGQQKINLISILVGLTVDISLNLLLIGNYSYLGATIANVTSFILVGLVSLIFFAHKIGFRYQPRKAYMIAIAGLLMGIILLMLKDWSWIGAGVVGGSFYLTFLVGLRLFDFKDIRALLRAK